MSLPLDEKHDSVGRHPLKLGLQRVAREVPVGEWADLAYLLAGCGAHSPKQHHCVVWLYHEDALADRLPRDRAQPLTCDDDSSVAKALQRLPCLHVHGVA